MDNDGAVRLLAQGIASRIVRNHYACGLGRRAGIVAGVALVLAHTVHYDVIRDPSTGLVSSRSSDAAYVAQARTDMIAGCVDVGASRAYCGCFTAEMIRRMGGTAERMRAMDAKLSRLSKGSGPRRSSRSPRRPARPSPAGRRSA